MREKPKSGIPKAVQTVRQCPERKIPIFNKSMEIDNMSEKFTQNINF